ncbi:T9SS type A sorting domain-containing protein [Tenacibaculum sp. 190524A02b]|uniref:T9SS type A sorting domain-containing protein n=1 Tax=Tenacibaculum vairaonense TaxID=3137860 RepID=UPI0031FB1B74
MKTKLSFAYLIGIFLLFSFDTYAQGINSAPLSGIEVTSTATWKPFSIPGLEGAGFGGWYSGGNFILEANGRNTVKDPVSGNIQLITENTVINASNNYTTNREPIRTNDYKVWDNQTGFIGFQGVHNGGNVYGWLKVTVTNVSGTITLSITEYAYNTTHDEPIIAGATAPAITWTGTTDNDWATASNWSSGSVPSTTDDVIIPNGLTNYPTISSSVTVNSINIASGASLVTGTSSVTGNVIYNRNLGTTNWYLVSSPVNGETIDNLKVQNSFAAGTGGDRIGIAPYKNDGTAWNYYTNSSTGAITSGQGYSVKLTAAGNISFSGTINSSNVTFPITQSTNDFNLIGNPYTSYAQLGTFVADNTSLSEATIWLWNQATSSYDTKVGGIDANFQIAPGQGFFVKAGSNTNAEFTTSNQSHQNDTFQRDSKVEVTLNAVSNKKTKSTKLYYLNGVSTSFDNGYDGTLFNGVSNNYEVFTQLVSENQGQNLAIQSLPLSNMETTIVPVGLIAQANETIEFSIQTSNLPNAIEVYIEDKKTNTITNITNDSYSVTLNEDLNNIGRFYLHTTSQKLSSDDINNSLSNISIYKSSNNELTITGLQSKKSTLNVYTVLGKQVTKREFTSNGISRVSLPEITTGLYIVEIASELGKTTKKIVIE